MLHFSLQQQINKLEGNALTFSRKHSNANKMLQHDLASRELWP